MLRKRKECLLLKVGQFSSPSAKDKVKLEFLSAKGNIKASFLNNTAAKEAEIAL